MNSPRSTPVHRPKVALVASGGTLTALADDPFEICDYGQAGSLTVQELIERFPMIGGDAQVIATEFVSVPSFEMSLPYWQAFLDLARDLTSAHPDLTGIVLTHGTGSLEETAFFLSLVWDLPIALAITGAQRPASAASSDGFMNLAQAIDVAAHPDAARLGVVVVANGEIHLPAEVAKTSNLSLGTFQSPSLGPVGFVVGRKVEMRFAPGNRFSVTSSRIGTTTLPRVDIVYCYTGGDSCAIDAFIGAGAQGIVIAGFAPGYATGQQAERLESWIENDAGIVVAASRAYGPVPRSSRNTAHGFIPAGRFSPAKARILLQLALLAGRNRDEISKLFLS